VLLFLCSAASVEYLSEVLPGLLAEGGGKEETKVLALHRRKKGKRVKILNQFRTSTSSCILLSTDLMARGVDVVDIDWVLQYDIPKRSNLFVHRSGRSGRMGRTGNSLVFLMPEESAYVDFVQKHEGVELAEWSASPVGQELKLSDKAAEKMRRRVQDMAIADRKVLEAGSAAFVSYIQAYCKHDCQIVCKVSDLDIVGIANSFGLLRMPKLRELKHRDDLDTFQPREDVSTGTIAFVDTEREEKRQADRQTRKEEQARTREEAGGGRKGSAGAGGKEKGRGKRRRMTDADEFEADNRLLKKVRRGRMSRGELDEAML